MKNIAKRNIFGYVSFRSRFIFHRPILSRDTTFKTGVVPRQYCLIGSYKLSMKNLFLLFVCLLSGLTTLSSFTNISSLNYPTDRLTVMANPPMAMDIVVCEGESTLITPTNITYTETFDTDGEGVAGICTGNAASTCATNVPVSNGQWSIEASNFTGLNDSDDFVLTNGGQLEFQDLDGEFCFVSSTIDISWCGSSKFTVEISEMGNMEGTDYVDIFYIVDGGTPIQIPNWMGMGNGSRTLIDDFTSATVTANNIIGNTLQIQVCVRNNSAVETHILEKVEVICEDEYKYYTSDPSTGAAPVFGPTTDPYDPMTAADTVDDIWITSCSVANGESAATMISVTVNAIPDAPFAEGAMYCEGEPMEDVIAMGDPGAIFTYYDDSALMFVIQTGATYSPSGFSETVYVTQTVNGCESEATQVDILVTEIFIITATAACNADGTFCVNVTFNITDPMTPEYNININGVEFGEFLYTGSATETQMTLCDPSFLGISGNNDITIIVTDANTGTGGGSGPMAELVITEVLPVPSGDQCMEEYFIITYNACPGQPDPLDISGVNIFDFSGLLHTFAPGTTIANGASIQLFSFQLDPNGDGDLSDNICPAWDDNGDEVTIVGPPMGVDATSLDYFGNPGTGVPVTQTVNMLTCGGPTGPVACSSTIVIEELECFMPNVMVVKDDADNGDDTQSISQNTSANFTITVTNTGNEPLCNITLIDNASDPGLDVTNCTASTSMINGLILSNGNMDSTFDPMESFTYTCTVDMVTADFINTIDVNAEGCFTGDTVMDNDNTEVLVLPNPPMAMDINVCDGESTLITPTSTESVTFKYYDMDPATGATPIFGPTVDSFDPNTSAGSTDEIWITACNFNGESEATMITVTVNVIPGAPAAMGATYCESDMIVDVVATGVSGATFTYYSDAALTMIIQIGAAYSPMGTVGIETVYVTQSVAGCESASTAVMITVNPNPNAPTAMNVDVCDGESTEITPTSNGGGTMSFTTTIAYEETFDTAGEGVAGDCSTGTCDTDNPPANGQWTITGDFTDLDDSADFVLTGAGLLEFQDTGEEVCYTSSMIDISACDQSNFTVDILETGNMEASDYVDVTLIVDGSPMFIPNWMGLGDGSHTLIEDFTNTTVFSNNIIGNNLQIQICIKNSAAAEQHFLDNIQLDCQVMEDFTFKYYDVDPTMGGIPVFGPTTGSYDPMTTAGTTDNIWITVCDDFCESAATMITVTVNEIPAAPMAMGATYCVGDMIADVVATGEAGATFTYYSDAALTMIIQTGATYTPMGTVGTETVYVTQTVNNCESASTEVIIIVNPNPAAPMAMGATYCDGDMIADVVATGEAGATFTYYSDAALTMMIQTGATYTPMGTVGTETVYVTQTVNNCESASTEVMITVNPIPAAPMAMGAIYCDGDMIADVVATGEAGATFIYYSDAALTMMIQTGATYTPMGTVGTETVYVTQTVMGCESASTEVMITVNPIPAAPMAMGATYCEGDMIADVVATGEAGATFTYYSDAALTMMIQTGATYTPMGTVGTETVYITQTAMGCESESTVVEITVSENPAEPMAMDITVCDGESTEITPVGGMNGSPASIVYVETFEEDGEGVAGDCGSGTCATDMPPANGQWSITGNFTGLMATSDFAITSGGMLEFQDTDTEVCFTSSLIDISGCTTSDFMVSIAEAGNMENIDYVDVNLIIDGVSNPIINWMGQGDAMHTLVDDFTSAIVTQTGITGSNMTVEICVLNNAGSEQFFLDNIMVGCEASGGGVTMFKFYDMDPATGAAPVFGPTTGSYDPMTAAGEMDMVWITACEGACESDAIKVTVIVNEIPAAPTAMGATYCDGDMIADVVATGEAGAIFTYYSDAALMITIQTGATFTPSGAVGTETVYVTQTVNGCESPATEVMIIVNPIPAAPAAMGANYCNGDMLQDVIATGESGATFTYYSDAALMTMIQMGANYTPTGMTETVYVTQTVMGCESTATQVDILVTSLENVMATAACNADGSFCVDVSFEVMDAASTQYNININGVEFGPFTYSGAPMEIQTTLCDPTFLGIDGANEVTIVVTDAATGSGAATGGGGTMSGSQAELVITEVLPDPVVDQCLDEYFIITYNACPGQADPLDISGLTISDNVGIRHTFIAGTSIASGASIQVNSNFLDPNGDGDLSDNSCPVWNNGGDNVMIGNTPGMVAVVNLGYNSNPGDGVAITQPVTTLMCGGGGGTSTACAASIIIAEPECFMPEIMVTKDDADNMDDIQTVFENGAATFTITVTNTGNEPLCNISLTDTATDAALDVSGCELDAAGIAALIAVEGNMDNVFDPNESFSFTCMVSSISIDFTNSISVSSEGCLTGETATDMDATEVLVCSINNLVVMPLCNANQLDYCVDVSFDFTNPGISNMYEVIVNGIVFGPFTYGTTGSEMLTICDPINFIGDEQMGLALEVADVDGDNETEGITVTGGGVANTEGCVEISAVMANQNADNNGDGVVDFCDEYVSLTNGGTGIIDISGYMISDGASLRHIFPAGSILNPGQTLLVFNSDLSEVNNCAGSGIWNNGGDDIVLSDDEGILVDMETYNGSTAGVENTFMVEGCGTSGGDGSTGPSACLQINSVMANQTADNDGDGAINFCDEFISVVNPGSLPLDISGFMISDGATLRHVFPAGTTLNAGQVLIIYNSDLSELTNCAGGGVWNNGGDDITIEFGVDIIDEESYGGSQAGVELFFTVDDCPLLMVDPTTFVGCNEVTTFDEPNCCPVIEVANFMGMSLCAGSCPAFGQGLMASGDCGSLAPNSETRWYADPLGLFLIFEGEVFDPIGEGLVDNNVTGETIFYAQVSCDFCRSALVPISVEIYDCNPPNDGCGGCTYFVQLYDTAFNGWDGARFLISINDGPFAEYKPTDADNGFLSFPIEMVDGGTIDYMYMEGNNAEEHGFKILNSLGEVVATEGVQFTGNNIEGSVEKTVKVDCPACCDDASELFTFVFTAGQDAVEKSWEIRDSDNNRVAFANAGTYAGVFTGQSVSTSLSLDPCEEYTIVTFAARNNGWEGGTYSILSDNPERGEFVSPGVFLIASGPADFTDELARTFTLPCSLACPDEITILADDFSACSLTTYTASLIEAPICYPNNCHYTPLPTLDVCYPTAIGGLVEGPLGATAASLPVGSNPVVFKVTYGDGQIRRCTSQVHVIAELNPTLVCNDFVIVPLVTNTEDCQTIITADMILEAPNPCNAQYLIELEDANGNEMGNIIDFSDAGQTFTYTISQIGTGLSALCEGQLLVEDKAAPTIDCVDYEVNCNHPDALDEFYSHTEIFEVTAGELPGNIAGGTSSNPSELLLPIPDVGCGPYGEIIQDINVSINLVHNDIEDLTILLVTPSGNTITLLERRTCNNLSSQNIDVTFDSEADLPVFAACNPGIPGLSGTFQPAEPLSLLYDFAYEDLQGDWAIIVRDDDDTAFEGIGVGEVLSASMEITAGFPFPYAATDCNLQEVVLLSEIIVETDCDQGEWLGSVIERVWQARDVFDNTTVCTQTVGLRAPMLSEIDTPADLELACGTVPNDPALLTPELGGISFFECFEVNDSQINLCDIIITYEDEVFPSCGDGYKIFRTWSVFNWCIGSSFDHVQTILVTDNLGPEITQSNIVIGTNEEDCTANVTLNDLLVTDACSAVTDISVSYLDDENLVIANLSNGEALNNLPFGENTVTITATDECLNTTSEEVIITVIDDVIPTAICNDGLNISLSDEGVGLLPAIEFDEGSNDNCSEVTVLIRSLGCEGEAFAETAAFACCDVGITRVELLVTDAAGNTNICWADLLVEDASTPMVTCADDMTVDCNEDLHVEDLFTAPTVSDNCSTVISESEIVELELPNCGQLLRKTYTVSDGSDKSDDATCQQTITVLHVSDFIVQFPADVTINICPEDIGAIAGPTLTEEDCENIGISVEDRIFTQVEDVCYKIERTYTIVNHCIVADPSADGFTDLGTPLPIPRTFRDDDGYFQYTQIIKVQDDEAPTITFTAPDPCDFTSNCEGEVVLMAMAEDACSNIAALDYAWKIDAFSDGTFDVEGTGNDATGIYPYGEHMIKWIVRDGCGNESSETFAFSVKDCKNPTPTCRGLTTVIMNNGDCVEINASHLLLGAEDNCTNRTTEEWKANARARLVGDNNALMSTVQLCCGDLFLNPIQVEVWVEDEAGNADFCIVDIDLQDNQANCDDMGTGSSRLIGSTNTEMGDAVSDVTISIDGTDIGVTNIQGNFQVVLDTDNNYRVAAQKNENHAEGISTFDLVLMAQHVLQINLLDSPYKLLAADINLDGKINIFDLVEERQLILYQIEAFSQTDSWMFVPADYVFQNPTAPYAENVSFFMDVDLIEDNTQANFIAIKMGDLDISAARGQITSVEDRKFPKTLEFGLEDKLLKAGSAHTLHFRAIDFTAISGYQFTMEFDPSKISIEGISSGAIEVAEGNFGDRFLSEGILTSSYNAMSRPVSVEDGETLFAINLKLKADIQLSEVLSIVNQYTLAEAYNESKELMGVDLSFTEGTLPSHSDFTLYQNSPNPFRNQTKIGFVLPIASNATLTIYDVAGKVLYQSDIAGRRGYNHILLDAEKIGLAGLLYYTLETATHSAERKMILLD